MMAVRGAELAVRVPDGPAPPLLWGHGLLSSMAAEDELGLFGWPDGPGYRVVRYDARGHGRSGGSTQVDDHRWPNLAADMLAVADGVAADRFVAGGASMGCATALHAAVAAPERILALVLVIPPTAWDSRRGQADLYRRGARLVDTVGLWPFLAMLRAAPLPGIYAGDARFREAGLAGLRSADRHTVSRILRGAALSDLPPVDALRELTMPALVLAWYGDPTHPISTAEAVADVLPQAESHHARTLTDVGAWPALVGAFLERALS